MASLSSKRKALLAQECLALQRQNGAFEPADFVAFAASHPDSEMHNHFTWDDGTAADQYRLLQARHLIKLYVRGVGPRTLTIEIGRVFSIPSLRGKGEGSYLPEDKVSGNEAWRQEVLAEVKSKLIDLRDSHAALLPELKSVWQAIKRIE